MENRRKGQFTIPDLVGTAVMLFLFSFLFRPMKGILINAASSSGPLLTAVLYSIPVVILVSILAMPFILSELRFEDELKNRRGGQRARR